MTAESGLPVAGDPLGTMTAGRMRAKRVASAVVAALEPLIGASIARYDEDWSPRAFGDNITAWGTPVVLVESGGLPAGRPLADLTRLNFVAFIAVLSALAADDAAGHDPAVYERLTRNRSDAFADIVVRGGRILQGAGGVPYRADIAFDVEDELSPPTGRRPARHGSSGSRTATLMPGAAPSAALPIGSRCVARPGPSRIVEIGDARFLAAGREVDAAGALIVPALTASIRGYGARVWLTEQTLGDMARLGVGRLRWHVPLRHVGGARSRAAERSGPGRPAIEVVAWEDPLSLLVLSRAPRSPASRALADALDALGAWGARQRSFAAALPLLTAPPGNGAAPILLDRGKPASFLVLRGAGSDAPGAGALEIEAVYVDGRALEAPPRRGAPSR